MSSEIEISIDKQNKVIVEIYSNGIGLMEVNNHSHKIGGRVFLRWKEWDGLKEKIEEAREKQGKAKKDLEKELKRLLI